MQHDSNREESGVLLVTLQVHSLCHVLLAELHIHISQELQKGSGSTRFILLFMNGSSSTSMCSMEVNASWYFPKCVKQRAFKTLILR
mgnify:FL=1